MNNDNQNLVTDYADDERLRGTRKRSIKTGVSLLKRLFEYLHEKGIAAAALKVRDANEFGQWLSHIRKHDGEPYKWESVVNFIEAAKSFYSFLKRREMIPSNPFKGMWKIKRHKRIPVNVPKEKDMARLLDSFLDWDGVTTFEKKRRYKMHVLCELMYSTGLRIEEASSLKASDIDFKCGIITLTAGKGGKKRFCFLNEYAKEILRLYMRRMRKQVFDDSFRRTETLFGVCGERLTIILNEELAKAGKSLSMGRLTSHVFRHSLGFHMLRAGCDIRHIQAFLGHKNLSSTEVYTKVEKEDLKRVLDAYHPRKWWKQNE